MAMEGDLIDFNVIESHKENIQALPSGRSAKALAQIYSPPLLGANASPQLMSDAHQKTRAAFERELLQADEADDPLDAYDRYVKWTLDAYPSAQATPQSQLLPLLERATKAFQSYAQYKNDPRYVRLWLHYIRFFSDAPREAFVFLARHSIGAELALYYEEFAAWLEGAGRWTQAEEVYELGIQANARPIERLSRKYNEFKRRSAAREATTDEPSSPALPIARPALAAKLDPYASTSAAATYQAASTAVKKPKSSKMQIFADSDDSSRPSSGSSPKGWENIGTLAERRKENHVAGKPMAGETLKAGKTNGGMQKMMIFKDTFPKTLPLPRHFSNPSKRGTHAKQCVFNPNNGKLECVAVNLEAVYPGGSRTEMCFEELRAQFRGWHSGAFKAQPAPAAAIMRSKSSPTRKPAAFKIFEDAPNSVPAAAVSATLADDFTSLQLKDENNENISPDTALPVAAKKARKEERANRTRKIEIPDVRHIKNETKTISINLDSPTGSKPKRKKSFVKPEATMTINTKEAMDEIYGIFSQPLPSHDSAAVDDIEDDSSVDDCTTDGESTGTGKLSAPASEYGEETKNELFGPPSAEEQHDRTDWSDYEPAKPTQGQDERENHAAWPGAATSSSLEEHVQVRSIPLQTEEHDARPYLPRQDPIPNHRLPFMTPIAEATESSLGTLTAHGRRELLSTKTPSRQTGALPLSDDDELMSSPFQEITAELEDAKARVLQPIRTKSTKGTISLGQGTAKTQIAAQVESTAEHNVAQKGPVITELQCNPMDPQLRNTILSLAKPSISTFEGYHSYTSSDGNKSAEIKKWARSVAKAARSSTPSQPAPAPPTVQFETSQASYTFRRELGAGTFAPVYLVENTTHAEKRSEDAGDATKPTHRRALEAIKMEDPPSTWEFYIINLAHRRLGVARPHESIIRAHEMHLFRDECFLIEQYRDQGTLLDLVNTCRSDANSPTGVDEMLAMWLTVELLRTVEALHAKQLIHGDLKGDNVLVRFDDPGLETDWSATYFPSGAHGWSSKGISLIDFGRGIDMKQFTPDVGFIADWKTSEADCAEMRELRPWTYQIDLYGLAGIIHSMLFGKYMETIGERGAGLGQGATKTYRIRESLKRYWQTDIWCEIFSLLLNPLAHLDGEENKRMPVLRGMRSCRERMESWLEENCEKGIGLKGMIAKLEGTIKDRKRKCKSGA